MKFKSLIVFIFTFLAFSLLAGCGGDGLTGGTTSGNGGNTTGSGGSSTKPTPQPSIAASIQLTASTTSIGTGNNTGISLTAKVKDAGNRLLPGESVDFSSTGGALEITSGTTSDAGAALATLTTSGDPTNRQITVTATVPGTSVSDSVNIDVSGSAITISGSDNLAVGDTTDLTIFIKDSTSTGIANQSYSITSSDESVASLSSSTSETNNSGQAIVSVAGVSPGIATITVTSLGLTQTYVINVSNDSFALSAPVIGQEVNINTFQTITLNWTSNGVAQAGKLINFSTTRGTLSANTATTDASGSASITITSNNIGPATLRATDAASGLTTSVAFEFVVPPVDVDSIDLQANKVTIGPNGEQSVLTATARDINNNLVKNVDVLFSITQDNSAGSISNGSDLTSSLGRASTIYTSSAATTAKDGVRIHAQVNGADCTATPGLCKDVYLTVAKSQLFVSLGTSNLMHILDDTRYYKEWTVLVTDASGNAVTNANVVVSIIPTYYYIGYYYKEMCGTGAPTGCVPGWYLDAGNPLNADGQIPNPNHKCINEDFNRDGIIDMGEDLNNNSVLDPRNNVTVPGTVTTDDTGYAVIKVIWAKNLSTWEDVKLTASASVSGTEASASAEFTLPVLDTDVNLSVNSIPDQVSPWYALVRDKYDPATGMYTYTSSDCFNDVSYVPRNVTALPDLSGTGVNVQWDPLKGASSYNVYYSPTSGVGSNGTKITGATSPTLVSLGTGTYYFVVTAVINGQETAISSEAAVTIP